MISDPRFFQLIAKISPMVFSAFDEVKGKLIYFNELAQKLLGLSAQELSHFSAEEIRNLVHPDDVHLMDSSNEELLVSREDRPIESTVRMRHSSGTYVWIHSRRMVFERDENNIPIKFAGVHEDITELKNLEQELKRNVEQLEAISYKNSHELRTPLASILGLLDLIDEKSFNSEFDRLVLLHLRKTVTKLDQVIHEINQAAKP